jgi:NADPH-dependent 2,4-dienoyl-CoA reductase/sulfur reductase-like enzyme
MAGANGNGLVIVGGGLASARAVKAYREKGGDGPVRLFSSDSVVPYHRPPLSKRYLRGEIEAEETFVEQESFYREHDVDVQLEAHAGDLRVEERTLDVDGTTVLYDQLLIASGATPRTLDVRGSDREGVFTLRRLDDSRRIREAAEGARHAVVVGAGFIGMEVAASLKQHGLEVTLIHRGTGLFEILRAHSLVVFLEQLYSRNGVELVFSDEVVEFGGHAQIDCVRTKQDRVYQAELAVVGVGVEPTTSWLDGSGLQIDDGVVVNERFETGAPDVYAVGDVARFYDPLFDRHRRIEHWSNANYQGTTVGARLAGEDVSYDVVSTFFTEVFGLTLRLFGDVDHFDEIVFRGQLEDEHAIGFYLQGQRLVATLVVGQDEETENTLKELIAARATAPDFERIGDDGASLDEVFVKGNGASA